ncbi:MAG: transposase [Anaerolineae bacterium]
MNATPISFRRRSIRLRDYDYAQQGAYFVTMCTQLRECFFDVPATRQIAEQSWIEIPQHFPGVELDEWIVMPNHVHAIILIAAVQPSQKRDAESRFSRISPNKRTLSVIVRTYKAAVTTQCRQAGEIEFTWQRNYYERIIRNAAELNTVRQYILDNPTKWDEDVENPKRTL